MLGVIPNELQDFVYLVERQVEAFPERSLLVVAEPTPADGLLDRLERLEGWTLLSPSEVQVLVLIGDRCLDVALLPGPVPDDPQSRKLLEYGRWEGRLASPGLL